jgi:xylulokinase
MTAGVLVGIDVGTSGVKVVVTDQAGRRLAEGAERYPLATEGSGAEQNAITWWEAVCNVCSRLLDGREVHAVAVTSQAPTFVPIDEDGRPTHRALTWLDRRAVEDGQRLARIVPDSRNGADPFFGTAKLPWFVRERPDASANTSTVLSANGFIVHRLCGVAALDDSTASLMQGFDDEHDEFDANLVEREPSLRLLPKIVGSADVVGHVTGGCLVVDGDSCRHSGRGRRYRFDRFRARGRGPSSR